MSKPAIVDIRMEVTCLEEDGPVVRCALRRWLSISGVAMVQRPRTGGIKTSKPKRLREQWMRVTLCPETCR